MPKPLFLVRPSGLYVRFRVPSDLRAQVGSRFLIRSLKSYRGDDARLVAAVFAVSLSRAFQALRQGTRMVDVKKLLEDAQRRVERRPGDEDGFDPIRPWTASGVRIGNVELGDIQVSGVQDTEEFIRFARSLIEAQPQAVAAPSVPVASEPEGEPSPLLSEAIESHLGDMTRRKLADDTISESRHTLRLFLATTGDIRVRTIKVDHVRKFLDEVRWWPALAGVKPQFRGMSVLDILKWGKAHDVPEPSPHTLNKHKQKLGAFLNGLVGVDQLNKNPLIGLKADIDTSTDLETGRPFTPEELIGMFEPRRFKEWAGQLPHRWWGPMLGLFSGARVNEVAQIHLDDVREIAGVWGVFLWKKTRGQKIKNKSSIRFLPLAQPLLNAGFLDFVEDMKATGHPRLFPHLPMGTKEDGTPNGKGYGTQLSKQFGAYAKTFGIEKGTGFHSFRHTISTALAERGVSSPDIALLTGHAVQGQVPTLEKHYIHIAQTATLPKRVKTLAKFKPPVALVKYERGQFAEALSSSLHA
jgi:integrase